MLLRKIDCILLRVEDLEAAVAYQRTRLSAPGSNEDESRVARKGHDRTTRCRFLAYQAE
jgi:hypothetical protein